MRLLNKKTLEVTFFLDEQVPPYIILSHRWSGAETSMRGFAEERHLSIDQWSPGTAKILTFCDRVKDYEAEYVWVDTCCIDKSSSAELQEAINSMYKWYQQAELCIVYISDVDLDTEEASREEDSLRAKLKRSEWFTRGWTLQELLAPRHHVFLDRQWKPLGTREDLSNILHDITKIKPTFFGNTPNIHAAPVAERMSWLSLRKTSRVEDMAYCMLGIFDINMTMLYGEGWKSFQRLQKEIIQIVDDESIFIWQPIDKSIEEHTCIPVLAPSPACFAVCRDVEIVKDIYLHRDPYRWTMKGLHFELWGQRLTQFAGDELQVILNCTVNGKRSAFDIRRKSHGAQKGSNVYQRLATTELLTLDDRMYSRPLTEEEKFHRQIHDLSFQSVNQSRHSRSAVMNYESESILFKVFIQ